MAPALQHGGGAIGTLRCASEAKRGGGGVALCATAYRLRKGTYFTCTLYFVRYLGMYGMWLFRYECACAYI
jgi:hypothetical protein